MANVSGKVTRTQNAGRATVPLAGVPVVLLCDTGNGMAVQFVTSGADGRYTFAGVPAGSRCLLVFPAAVSDGGTAYEIADAFRAFDQGRAQQNAKYAPGVRALLDDARQKVAALDQTVSDPNNGLAARLAAAEVEVAAMDQAVNDPATGLGAVTREVAAIKDPAAGLLFQATQADTALETRLKQQEIDPLKVNVGALLLGRKPIPNADLL